MWKWGLVRRKGRRGEERSGEVGVSGSGGMSAVGVLERRGALWTYITPYPARLQVAAQIEGCEAAVADGEFFARGVECRLEDGDAVVL